MRRIGEVGLAVNAPITVLTVSIPGREDLLSRQVSSIYAQTVPVDRQLICAHLATTTIQPQVQYSSAKNDLLESVRTEFVSVLNDDDVWFHHHVETIFPYMGDADVVYTWDIGGSRPRVNMNEWDHDRIVGQMEEGNVVDGNCLIRASMLREVGGFPVDWVGPGPRDGGHYRDSHANFEDWELWRRMLRLGAQFRCVPIETYRYSVDTPGRIGVDA